MREGEESEANHFMREVSSTYAFNREIMGHVFQENKELGVLGAELVVDAKNGGAKKRVQAGSKLEEDNILLKQRANKLRASVERRRRLLGALRDKLDELAIETREDQHDRDQIKQIRVLENSLDLVTIKLNEAYSIRKTYEGIIAQVKEEQVGYTRQMARVEKELQRRTVEVAEKGELLQAALRAREEAHQALVVLESNRKTIKEQRTAFLRPKSEPSVQSPHRVNSPMRHVGEEKMEQSHMNDSQVEVAREKAGKSELESLSLLFKKIFETSGAKDINEVCQKFINQAQTDESIEELRAYYASRISLRREELRELRKRVEVEEGVEADMKPQPFQELEEEEGRMRKRHSILAKKYDDLEQQTRQGRLLSELIVDKLKFIKTVSVGELNAESKERWLGLVKEKIRWMKRVLGARRGSLGSASYVNPLLLDAGRIEEMEAGLLKTGEKELGVGHAQ